jgi:Raf kinase inhibitor-like YbhB/YbcL family protein
MTSGMKPLFVLALLTMNSALAGHAPSFLLTSPSFDDGASLPLKQVWNRGECKGKNESPALEWTDGPEGTKSYAVTVFDPDAPSGSGWWHWVLFNIPSTVTSLREGMKKPPAGTIQARNDWSRSQFDGACPPKGDRPHRYVITVYALKTEMIPLGSDASGALVGYYIHQNELARASISATYSH